MKLHSNYGHNNIDPIHNGRKTPQHELEIIYNAIVW